MDRAKGRSLQLLKNTHHARKRGTKKMQHCGASVLKVSTGLWCTHLRTCGRSSSPPLQCQQKIIGDPDQLMGIALECIYSCERDDQLNLCYDILECLPQRGYGWERDTTVDRECTFNHITEDRQWRISFFFFLTAEIDHLYRSHLFRFVPPSTSLQGPINKPSLCFWCLPFAATFSHLLHSYNSLSHLTRSIYGGPLMLPFLSPEHILFWTARGLSLRSPMRQCGFVVYLKENKS